MYASVDIRSNITHTVNLLSQFNNNPDKRPG